MAKASSDLNPPTLHREFLGAPGTLFITLAVPATTYALYYSCSETSGGCPPPLWSIPVTAQNALTSADFWKSLWDTRATVHYLLWYAFCVAAWAVVPGDWIDGVTLRTGGKIRYKINAFATFFLAMGISAGMILFVGPESFTFIYNHWVHYTTASVLMATAQGLYCYWSSYQPGALLALGGNTGNFIYDFFIGRELNPSFGSFDIKSFNELRPGLILWALIDISMACEQFTRLGRVTDSMILVLLFHIGYVADGLYNEPAIFTTRDITTDGFGFMLSIGDLTWVPFVYSLQARYLVFHPTDLGLVRTVAILALNGAGYYIFRVANSEKNDFRNGKNPKNLEFLTTESGSKLITSGWWGRSRHPNYFGDLVMALAWSLPTGFDSAIPYFYVAYFTVLLVHRQYRDDEDCEKKYGKDWHRYTKLVKYRIIPYVY